MFRRWLRGWWQWFLAVHRIDLNLVCELSKGRRDYHDFPDDERCEPWHFVPMKCVRCGKTFFI